MKNIGYYETALQKQGYITNQKLLIQIVAGLNMKPFPVIALRGAAGTGKTFLAESISKIVSDSLPIVWQGYRNANESELFINFIPDDKSISGIKKIDGVLTKAAKLSRKRKVVVLLDEWDKLRESADAVLLTFLQSGEIPIESIRVKANLSNLIIFIGMNDTRPYGEYFLRRVSIINFKPLSTKLVREALLLTHPNHPQLIPALRLYEMSIEAGLEKPATIQELRQLLDACTVLGKQANWEDLIQQFVIKTPDDYELLMAYSYQYKPNESSEEDESSSTLNKEVFEELEPEPEESTEEKETEEKTFLPQIKKIEREIVDPFPIHEDNEEISLSINNEENEAYTHIIKKFLPESTNNPNKFGKFRVVEGNNIISDIISLKEILSGVFDSGQAFVEEQMYCNPNYIKRIIEHSSKILHYTNKCIIGEYNEIQYKISSTVNLFKRNSAIKVELRSENVNKDDFKFFEQSFDEIDHLANIKAGKSVYCDTDSKDKIRLLIPALKFLVSKTKNTKNKKINFSMANRKNNNFFLSYEKDKVEIALGYKLYEYTIKKEDNINNPRLEYPLSYVIKKLEEFVLQD